MSKLPAFQFYPGDWRKDPGVQSLSFHDRGVWFEIICLMHESDRRGVLLLNGKAMPEDALARLLGLDNQILTTTLTTLLTFGVASREPETGAIMSRRMVRDEEIRQVRKSCGKLGGNPNLVNQIPTTQVNQIPTPSSSSSSSTSIKEESPQVIKSKKTYKEDSDPWQAANFLATFIKRWDESVKITDQKLQGWAREADLMNRIDNRSWDDFRELLRWFDASRQKPSRNGFTWAKVIRSMGSIREKWNDGKFYEFQEYLAKGQT